MYLLQFYDYFLLLGGAGILVLNIRVITHFVLLTFLSNYINHFCHFEIPPFILIEISEVTMLAAWNDVNECPSYVLHILLGCNSTIFYVNYIYLALLKAFFCKFI